MTEEKLEQTTDFRRFYLRVVLAFGIAWGILPLVMVPFIHQGRFDSPLDVWAAIVNGLTLSPASMLAFWQRRIASIWMTLNAALVASSIILFIARSHQFRIGAIIGALMSVTLAVLVAFAEAKQWPNALSTR